MVRPRILTIGDVCAEMLLKTPCLPEKGGCQRGDNFFEVPGGAGLNAAVALARLGADPILAARLGDDGKADELTDYLSSEGVDTRFISKTRGENTALTVRLAEDGVPERRIVYPGAGEKLRNTDVEETFICYPDAVILQRGLPSEAVLEAVKSAAENNVKLVLISLPDASLFPPGRMGSCEILIVDEEDAVRLTGIRPSDQEKCMKACLSFAQQVRTKYTVLRLGERGCFLYDGLYYHFYPAYDVPQPAGVSSAEAFSSAVVLEYLRSGGDMKRACEFAMIVCAIFLTRGGRLRGYPTNGDVRRFIARNEIDFDFEE